jgi:hypothetical protein
MSGAQMRAHLELLGLSQTEAAELLGTNSRTVRRWVEHDNEEIPGPAEQALRAWARLHRAGWAWRPDHEPLAGEGRVVQDSRRLAAYAVSDALERVRRRGGVVALWDVDLIRQRATLGAMQLHFQVLADGGFVPQSYRPGEGAESSVAGDADFARDTALLEDGVACIARALARAHRAWLPALRLAPAVVVGDRVILWEDRSVPTLALVVPGAVARAVMGPFTALDEVLFMAHRHHAALVTLARQLALEPAGEVNALGVRELSVEEAHLRRSGVTRSSPDNPLDTPPEFAPVLRADLAAPEALTMGPTP